MASDKDIDTGCIKRISVLPFLRAAHCNTVQVSDTTAGDGSDAAG